MRDKRGQGLSVNAIILIVLGVIVLVILVIGFFAGWDKIAPWIKPSNNVNEITQACSIACSTSSVYDYCTLERKLTDEDKNEFTETCHDFATNTTYGQYGVAECPGLC